MKGREKNAAWKCAFMWARRLEQIAFRRQLRRFWLRQNDDFAAVRRAAVQLFTTGGGAAGFTTGRPIPPAPLPAFMLPFRPAIICVIKSFAAPGEFDRNTVLFPCLVPISRSEEHTSELQSLRHLVCRLLLE